MTASYKLRVSEMTSLSPRVKVIRFNLNGQPFSFHAGQYLMLGVDLGHSGTFEVRDGKKTVQERPFSISSNPLQKDFVEVTVVGKEDGFTADYFINHMSVNEEVNVRGPLGDFFFDESRADRDVVLLGAGSGIMPLVSIASYIAEKGLKTKVYMLFSFRDQDRIILKDSIDKLSKNPNFSSDITLTRENWNGSMGRIDRDKIMKTGFAPHNTDFYICGPSEFKKDMENILITQCFVPITNIFK